MHSFDPIIAQRVGINAAVIYQNIAWWCQKNAANERNIIDGRVWSYNSIRAFTTLFPYLTEKQVRTALETLESEGMILVANYNDNPRDRTKWYAVCDQEVAGISENPFAPEGKSICPTGQTHLPYRANPFAPEGKPLPDNKPDNKPDIKPMAHRDAAGGPAGQEKLPSRGNLPDSPVKRSAGVQGKLADGCASVADEFERVWEHYPRKVGKGAARKAWAKARRGASFSEITGPLGAWIRAQRGTPLDKTPHFSTWLNQERWLDDPGHGVNRAQTSADRLDALGAASGGSPTLPDATRKLPEIEWRN